ncbi:MAG: radical SAM protein [Planctomycetes bacterium]|nr:radical SAM protein [Planctomycetota bacterium]
MRTAEKSTPEFDAHLQSRGLAMLVRRRATALQVNVGKLCNQACHHCHVAAGPKRTEIMEEATAERLLEVLERSPDVGLVDITGGAPELNPWFRRITSRSRELGRAVSLRSNLTVLVMARHEDEIGFLAENRVKVIASLPCYTAENVDQQRGSGVFADSIEALRRLNAVGYGIEGSGLDLDLVYNPLGAFLPPAQDGLEAAYHERLFDDFGVSFNRLYAITNMPIKRFSEMLAREGKKEAYMSLLVDHFNDAAASEVMCRDLVSMSWDGRLFDCDFNQMLKMPLERSASIFDVDSLDELTGGAIRTASHCFGCTAGSGSSCGGALT